MQGRPRGRFTQIDILSLNLALKLPGRSPATAVRLLSSDVRSFDHL